MNTPLEIRQAKISDLQELEKFLNFEFFVHQHLDWFNPGDWIENEPFLLAFREKEIVACLSVFSEVKDIAWLRIFGCSSFYSREQLWNILFSELVTQMKGEVSTVAVLGIHDWFVKILKRNLFNVHQEIIVLERLKSTLPNSTLNPNIVIQPLHINQVPQTAQLDARCFDPIWQLPENSMLKAYVQSGYATAAFLDQQLVGYQITTETPSFAHLARLAVDPGFQGKNIGKTLVYDLIENYLRKGIRKISVNTQNDNLASKALYKTMGFIQNSERYPVLIYSL